jgi:hypothetical protein
MRPLHVVVRGVLGQQTLRRCRSPKISIRSVSSVRKGQHKALGEAVRPRTAGRDLDHSIPTSASNGVSEDIQDRPHQVVVHHLVLVGPDAQRRMLVRDARQQALRDPLGCIDQRGGKRSDGAGESLLLFATRLVASVERAVR